MDSDLREVCGVSTSSVVDWGEETNKSSAFLYLSSHFFLLYVASECHQQSQKSAPILVRISDVVSSLFLVWPHTYRDVASWRSCSSRKACGDFSVAPSSCTLSHRQMHLLALSSDHTHSNRDDTAAPECVRPSPPLFLQRCDSFIPQPRQTRRVHLHM
jgi:hypothetical protein